MQPVSRTVLFALIFHGIVSVTGCREKSTDEVLSKLVDQYDAGPYGPVEEIWKYRFDGESVYYIPPKCCDIPSMLFDERGDVLCSPDGGFTGDGDGRCPDFFKNRKSGKLIWNAKREDRAR